MAAYINCVVALDEPGKIHYGHEEPIRGQVQIRCSPGAKTTSTELFGPLKIVLDFSARAKSKIWRSSGGAGPNGTGRRTHIYRGRAPLFSLRTVVVDEPFRAAFGTVHSFPFEVQFPREVQLGSGVFEPSPAFENQPGHPLPPTMAVAARGFGCHFECFVASVIQAHVFMPGIDIQINPIPELSVSYSPRGVAPSSEPTRMLQLSQWCQVQNKELLPEEERPKGFRANTKALLSSDYYPRFVFNAYTIAPTSLQIGEKPFVSIRIERKADIANTPKVAPDVELRSISVRIKAHTSVRAERTLFREHTDGHSDTAYFSAAGLRNAKFTAEQDWTIGVHAKAIPPDVLPSFTTYNIACAYLAEFHATLFCAGKTFNLEKSVTLPILPMDPVHYQGQLADPANMPGSSSLAATITTAVAPAYSTIPQPPAYNSVMDAAAGAAAGAVAGGAVTGI